MYCWAGLGSSRSPCRRRCPAASDRANFARSTVNKPAYRAADGQEGLPKGHCRSVADHPGTLWPVAANSISRTYLFDWKVLMLHELAATLANLAGNLGQNALAGPHRIMPSMHRWPLFVLCAIVLFAPTNRGDAPPAVPRDTLPDKLSLDVMPLGLGPRPIPADNPLTAARVRLGRRLFFDLILSADGTVACASCHRAAHGFSSGPAGWVTSL
jgi:hypothetical protein